MLFPAALTDSHLRASVLWWAKRLSPPCASPLVKTRKNITSRPKLFGQKAVGAGNNISVTNVVNDNVNIILGIRHKSVCPHVSNAILRIYQAISFSLG